MENFEKTMKTSKHHVTVPRKHVFSLLNDADIPMGISDLTSELRTIDRATVYRTIELFNELSIIKRVWFGNETKYELSDAFQAHHHHLVCEMCGLITKIDNKDIERMLLRVTRRYGYKHLRHQVEIIGLCSSHK